MRPHNLAGLMDKERVSKMMRDFEAPQPLSLRAAADDAGMPPMPPLLPPEGYAKFPAGSSVRDILSGRIGTVTEKPAGEFGDIVFVTDADNNKTYPMRSDQLEANPDVAIMAPPMAPAPDAAMAPAPDAAAAPAAGAEGLPPVPAEGSALPAEGGEGEEAVKASAKLLSEEATYTKGYVDQDRKPVSDQDAEKGKKMAKERREAMESFDKEFIKAGGVQKGGDHPGATDLDWTETPESFTFTANPALQEELKAAVAAGTSQNALSDLLEALMSNSDIDWIRPEEIGALTDAPIFGHVERDDQGKVTMVGHVWWYPDYAVKDPIEVLANTGTVTFAGAPENMKEKVQAALFAAPKKSDVDAEIGRAWSQHANGVQIPIMSIPAIYREIKEAMAGGKSMEEAVKESAAKHRVNAAAYAKVVASLDKSVPVSLPKVIAALGGVPVYWDYLLASLRHDGFKVPAASRPKVKADLLRKQGKTPAEVKTELCGAGVTLAAAKSALVTASRILSAPLTKKPDVMPTAGMQWVWDEGDKAWVEQPAVTASKVSGGGSPISKEEAQVFADKLLKGKALLGDSTPTLTIMRKQGFGGEVVGKGASWEEALVDTAINVDGMGMNGTFEDVKSRLEGRRPGDVRSAKVGADYTGACSGCGKNLGGANITMAGHPGKKFCSDACVNKAYADLSPSEKAKVKKVGDKHSMSGAEGLDPMVQHYLVTALWSSSDNSNERGGEPFDRNHNIEEFTPEALEQAKKDCADFLQQAGDLVAGVDPDQVGHDFWLTRNGHGAGFWDRPEMYGGKENADKLTAIAKGFGELNVDLSDDGKLYFM